ncbi:epimerase [Haloferula sp. BvORR071]|uniref:epimerase n=1 Tax=Haloferula sp. BvORR071 TaxID=1396141 RepID=UPI000550A214|nr:epimerase [Haloferula sp. BvORR071]
MNRRDSIKLAAATGASALAAQALGQQPPPPASKPLRILILGGTGFTGPHQVRYALARGHKLTLFNRGRRPKEWPGEVEELTGDRDKGDLKALEGREGREWDVCIDNPTSVPFWVRDAGKVLAGKVKHYVFISTVSVYADTSKPGMDESTPLHKYEGADAMAETNESLRADMGLYGPLKAESEREAEKQFPRITTIIRPTLIVGPGDETDRFTYWPARIQKGGEVLAPPAEDPVQIIDARDLAEWTIRMTEQRAFGAFNACGPDYELGMGAMLHGIRAVTTAGAKFTFVTADFLKEQKVAPWAHLPVWLPAQGDTAGFARTSIVKALAAGLTFRPLATTTSDTLTWFNAQPEERRTKLRAGISPEREAALLKAWHAKT